MAKLRVNWAPEKLLTLDEVVAKPGYYLNAISGDIYRNEEPSEETVENAPVVEIAEAAHTAASDVDARIWLPITDDLDLSEGDVRGMVRDVFNLRMEEQGRFVLRTPWQMPGRNPARG